MKFKNFKLLVIILLLSESLFAASINLNIPNDVTSVTSRLIQFLGLVTILSVAPSILMMVTSFTRIVVVFSFLRSALGLQQSPPNVVLVSLSLFLTLFIMNPVFMKSYEDGIAPLIDNKINESEAIIRMAYPFKEFMIKNVRAKDVELFADINKIKIDITKIDQVNYSILIPAFMISELRKAFEIGFMLFLPFVIIDILVSSVLMSMGMMMIPPMMISLPFKIIFFVLIDGWYMICGSLVKSFVQ